MDIREDIHDSADNSKRIFVVSVPRIYLWVSTDIGDSTDNATHMFPRIYCQWYSSFQEYPCGYTRNGYTRSNLKLTCNGLKCL